METREHQHIENKIFHLHDREKLQPLLKQWHASDQTLVFTNGCFDILHRGHTDYLAKAADLGHVLLVALNTDESVKRLKGLDRPVNSEQDRAFVLACLGFVSAVVLFSEDTPLNLIRLVKPDYLVKGGDYSENDIVGAGEVKKYGGRVISIPLLPGYSTTSLISKLKKFRHQ